MTEEIPSQGRLLWFYENANIPANFVRDTNYDDRFIQVVTDDSTVGVNGGGSHTPTVADHTDTWNAHTHTFSAGAGSGFTYITGDAVGGLKPRGPEHTHVQVTSSPTTMDSSTGVITLDAGVAVPVSVTTILIKPVITGLKIPADCVAFVDGDVSDAGFKICDGNNGTIDLNGKFIIGATTGSDGGASTGVDTHLHIDSTGHCAGCSHAHVPVTCGAAAGTIVVTKTGTKTAAQVAAHHTVGLNNDVFLLNLTYVNVLPIDNKPAYSKLVAVQNKSGLRSLPKDIIIIYEDTKASIPAPWQYYDFGDFQIEVTIDYGSVGGSYSSNNESHGVEGQSDENHLHIQSHTHDHVTVLTSTRNYYISMASSTSVASPTHTHTWTSNANSSSSNPVTGLTAVSSDKRYNYRNAILIKYCPPTGIPGIEILSASESPRSFNQYTSPIDISITGSTPNVSTNEKQYVSTAEDTKISVKSVNMNNIILNNEECIKTGNTSVNTIILTASTKTDSIVSTNKLSGDSDKKTDMNIGAAI